MADREIISIRLRTRKDEAGQTNRELAKWGAFPTWLGGGGGSYLSKAGELWFDL